MNKETINKAADEFAEREYEVNDIDKYALHKGFYHGACWRINVAWHTDLKDAQTRRPLIVEFVSLRIEIFDDKRNLKGIEDLVVRFAYVDDLVPEGNE